MTQTYTMPIDGTRVIVHRDINYSCGNENPEIKDEPGTVVPCDGCCGKNELRCFHVELDRLNTDFEPWNNHYILYEETLPDLDMVDAMNVESNEAVTFERFICQEISIIA